MSHVTLENIGTAYRLFCKISERRVNKPKDSDGTRVVSLRKAGSVKTWKKQPGRFQVNYKYGLYDNIKVTEENCKYFFLTEKEAREEGEVY